MIRPIMMKLLAGLGMALIGLTQASAEDAVYSCTAADGSTELLSAPNGGQCEKLVASPDAAPAAASATASASAPDGAAAAAAGDNPGALAVTPQPAATMKSATLIPPPQVAQAPRNAVENRLSEYRATMVDQASQVSVDTQQATSPTSASNRRYLMVNRTTYRQQLGISGQ